MYSGYSNRSSGVWVGEVPTFILSILHRVVLRAPILEDFLRAEYFIDSLATAVSFFFAHVVRAFRKRNDSLPHVGECLFPRLSVRNHFLIAGTQHRFSLAGREIIGTGVHVLDVEVPDVLI